MTETVQGFYSMLAQVWRDGVLDISITRLMLALGVFLFFAALRGLFTRFVLRRLERITERTETEFDDLLRDAIEEPLKLLFLVKSKTCMATATLEPKSASSNNMPNAATMRILRSLPMESQKHWKS